MSMNQFPSEWDNRACYGSCSISSVTTYCLPVFRDYGSIASFALSHGALSMLEECTDHYFESCKWLIACPCQIKLCRQKKTELE